MSGIKIDLPLSEIPGIGPRFLERLRKLGIKTVRELIYHFPARYEDFSQIYKISDVEPGEQVTVRGIVEDIKMRQTWKRRMAIVEAVIRDDSGTIRAIWFNQPYVLNTLRAGRMANFAGKISISDEDEIYLSHPAYEIIRTTGEEGEEQETRHTARLVPIYPETRGLTSKGLRYLIQPILKNVEPSAEWLPQEILRENKFPEINSALKDVHFPENTEDALTAKKRFVFEDLFLLQLANLSQKLKLAQEKAQAIKTDIEHLKKIISELPYELTFSQKRSLWEIIQDIGKPRPMNRLLQGDVGSGKTVVAALASVIAAENGMQTAFMAPTEVLARQHFETLKKLFAEIPSIDQPAVGLLTSSEAKIIYSTDLEAKIKKAELQEKIKSGEVKIVLGTHALIQKDVVFGNLAFVIIDEQHRFGVRQRQALASNPNVTNTSELSEQNVQHKIIEKELSYKLNGIFFDIQKNLGRYCRERQYSDAIEKWLKQNNVSFKREQPIKVAERKSNLADFIVAGKILLEIKAKPFITKEDYMQTMRYLTTGNLELGLIVNFRQEYLKPKRVLNPSFISGHSGANSEHSGRVLVPHLLSMSATPIPRTLMLTVFGDLDISLITELPAGRKNIVTKIIPPQGRNGAYEFIRGEVRSGRQVFVICPRIDPSQSNEKNKADGQQAAPAKGNKSAMLWEVKSVKEEFEKLSKKNFKDMRVAMLHGQMKPKEKEEVMKKFRAGETDILVSTSVVEVGVDVSNATIMMIEGADRFGLAQIYQFRGRVGRGKHQSYCFLFTDSSAKTTQARLRAVIEAKNGFELAEKDLKLRGPGQFLGEEQAGFPDTAMSGLMNPELVKASREAAEKLLGKNGNLSSYPLLKEKLSSFRKQIHLE